jgi:hypothetical protein
LSPICTSSSAIGPTGAAIVMPNSSARKGSKWLLSLEKKRKHTWNSLPRERRFHLRACR